jgi:polyisoprenoid-binding protein YceI
MKPIASLFLVTASILTSAALHAAEYKLTGDNTTVKFLGTKKDGKHEGSFKKLAGTFSVDGDVTKSKLEVTIDIDSMVTDATKLTAHLKSPDFFDAKRFPEAKFVSKSIKAGADGYVVAGDLTMHGVTKPLSFPAKIDLANGGVTVSSQFDLNRHEWGISYGKGNVNDLVKMTLEVKAK